MFNVSNCLLGAFELIDPSGCPSGHIEVMLKWKYTYLPPPGSPVTPEQAKFIVKSTLASVSSEEKDLDDEEKDPREEEPKQKAPPPTRIHSHSTLSVVSTAFYMGNSKHLRRAYLFSS